MSQLLLQHISQIISSHYPESTVPSFELELSLSSKFGDYACNAAMVLGKILKENPLELAEKLAVDIRALEMVESAVVAGPGFINLTMTGEYWADKLSSPSPETARKGKVQVEFISANPTGPMTLANARGGFVGDTLAAVLSEDGWEAEREYYLNDTGGQVTKLADSVRAESGIEIAGERQYQGEYLAELAAAADPRALPPAELERKLVATVVDTFLKPAVARMHINFDTWFSEASLAQSGEAARVIDILRAQDLISEQDNAVWLRSTVLGDERDRVLIRTNGEPTYLLGDLAYHLNIFEQRKFDRAIKLWGADHAGQVQSLRLGLKALVPSATIDFVLLQFVRLIRNGVEMKMSKRAGTYVTIDELLDMLEEGVGPEHAVNVARWFFLSRSVDNRIDFDLDVAAEESQKNPYFYVMYSYARAQSLLEKAKENDLVPTVPAAVTNAWEVNLVKAMTLFDMTIGATADDFGVQRLPHAGYEMAKAFTALYEAERILDLPVPEATKRLYVVQCYISRLERLFKLMGVRPVKRMQQKD